MLVTEELRAVIACLEQRDRTFMANCVSSRQTKSAIGFHPIGYELPEGFTRDLLRHLENATRVAKLENGQVYFFWDHNDEKVSLYEGPTAEHIFEDGSVNELNGSDHDEPGEVLTVLKTFTLDSLFES